MTYVFADLRVFKAGSGVRFWLSLVNESMFCLQGRLLL